MRVMSLPPFSSRENRGPDRIKGFPKVTESVGFYSSFSAPSLMPSSSDCREIIRENPKLCRRAKM